MNNSKILMSWITPQPYIIKIRKNPSDPKKIDEIKLFLPEFNKLLKFT